MAITRILTSGVYGSKYNDVLAGLPGVMPAPTAADGGTGTTATVSFTAVSGATSYTAISTPGSLTGTAASSPVTVSGLTTGTAYTFQIAATNTSGQGAYSAASNSVTPEVPGAYESIASFVGTGSAGNITFSSIPGTYRHLQLRVSAMTTSAGFSPDIRFNGDSGTNYAWHNVRCDGSTASANGVASAAQIGGTWANGTTTSNPSVLIFDIHNYAVTTQFKTIRNMNGQETNSNGMITVGSGLWQSTAAITSILINIGGAAFTTTSTFALYGIKGA
jgi:hypothetical protein